jgi:hypothetical protein
MKHLLASLTLGIFLTAFSVTSDMDVVIGALKKNDASALAAFFDNTVDLTLPRKSNSYSKSQAQMVLRDFLAANPVIGFEVIYRNESSKAQYCVGNLLTSRATYRTTLFLKFRGGKAILQELRIENK